MTLKELRQSMNLRLVDIAKGANMSTTYYSHIERCMRYPNLVVIERLAKAYKLDRMIIINALYEQLNITRSTKGE